MFYKEIYEQIEPGSLFLDYLVAQISKISPLSANHGGAFMGSLCVMVCPKKNTEKITENKKKLNHHTQH